MSQTVSFHKLQDERSEKMIQVAPVLEGQYALPEELLSKPANMKAEDVITFLGISRPSFYKLTHRPDFPSLRIGRVLRVPRDAFIRWYLGQQQ